MLVNKLLIIGACLWLQSCTPIERQVAEEVALEGTECILHYMHDHGATAPRTCPVPPPGANFDSVKKQDDTKSSSKYSNKQQYPKSRKKDSDWRD